MATRKTTEEKLASILERAKAGNYEKEGLFVTTYEAYCTQTKIMEDLSAAIDKEGAVVTTVYMADKKRETTKPSQLIADYNKTSTARNGTVATLLKIESQYSKPAESKLMDFE